MDGFTYRLIPTEREGNVTHAARDFGGGRFSVMYLQLLIKSTRNCCVSMPCFSENVRVEDNIFWREAHFIDENAVRTSQISFLRCSVSYRLFIERHDNNGICAISLACSFSMNSSSPSLMSSRQLYPECTSGQLMISHFDTSIMTRTRAMSGSEAIRSR